MFRKKSVPVVSAEVWAEFEASRRESRAKRRRLDVEWMEMEAALNQHKVDDGVLISGHVTKMHVTLNYRSGRTEVFPIGQARMNVTTRKDPAADNPEVILYFGDSEYTRYDIKEGYSAEEVFHKWYEALAFYGELPVELVDFSL